MKKVLFFALLAGLLAFMAEPFSEPQVRAAQAQAPATDVAWTATDHLKVVLLGSAVGPLVNLQQFGASTLVEAGNVRLLFDDRDRRDDRRPPIRGAEAVRHSRRTAADLTKSLFAVSESRICENAGTRDARLAPSATRITW